MQHPKDPHPSDDDAPLPRRTRRSGHQPGGEFSRPRSSPRPPGMPRPAPAAPPETHHSEAYLPSPEVPGPPEEELAGSHVLFEAWDPPDGPADPWWDAPLPPEFDDQPAGELVELPLVRAGGSGGSGGSGEWPPRRTVGAGWDGPRHARPGRRPAPRDHRSHWSGALLALTGALALAGAVPLGILGVRTLADRPAPAMTTSPMADGSAIKAPASAPAGAPSQLSQGQTAVAPSTAASPGASSGAASPSARAPAPASSGPGGGNGATSGAAAGAKAATLALAAGPGCSSVNGVITFPYQAPDGDGWQSATASRSGPCGSSFTYSLLANVRDASGDWHDHYAWIFHTGRKVASCTMSFYIPPSAHATSSAFYWISTGSDNPENRMADLSIDQQSSQGQWVTKGPLTFPGGVVLVELTDRGVGPVQDAVEAGVLQLRCV